MILVPTSDYRYAFKRGMSGTDVAALQINLSGVTVDGYFGAETQSAVEKLQEEHNLTVDGIAGLDTQRMICRLQSGPYGKLYKLPAGMLISIIANESGFALAAYSPHPSDSGYDLGAYQRSLSSPTQQEIRDAYSVKIQAARTGEALRNGHDKFADPWPVDSWYVDNVAEGKKGHLAWQLAVLDHNWPYAAEGIWKRGSIFSDPAKDTEPVEWVEEASAGHLHTPREWAVSYIERATVYVRWPS